jgi:hypothetical protein
MSDTNGTNGSATKAQPKMFTEKALVDAIHEAISVGEEILVEDVVVDQTQYLNFILANRSFFKSMTLLSSVEYMFERARAEITRQIKSAEEAKRKNVLSLAVKELGMTVEEAKMLLGKAAQLKREAAQQTKS